MTMKKRFLGLALAAMVAVPATTAYADTITMKENETKDHSVTVTGTVRNSQGQAPAGTIEVELPTSMQFAVDENGDFTGSQFTVKNKSTVGIDVSIASFAETKPGEGITLIPMSTQDDALNTKSRNEVALQLVGDKTNTVDLAEFVKQGPTPGSKLLTVGANDGVGIIQLTGKAGKQVSGVGARSQSAVDQNGIQEDFNLVFQIKKTGK